MKKKTKFLVNNTPVLIDYELHQVLVDDDADPDRQLAILRYLHLEGFLEDHLVYDKKDIDTDITN